jgi:transposase
MNDGDAGAWVGIDAGKGSHRAHMVDASGIRLLSRKVENDEAELAALIEEVLSLAQNVVWAIDQPGGSAALLLALLWERGQRVVYVPGLTVDRARDAYRGESKTDAKDAHVIADQARMRSDLGALEPGEAALAELQLLLARRRDLVTDQTRTIIRLKEVLLSLFPALERALDLNRRGALTLVAHYQRLRHGSVGRAASVSLPTSETAVSKEPRASLARPSPQPEPRALHSLPKR